MRFGFFRLSEGTEGEDGSLTSGCGWLEILCVEVKIDCGEGGVVQRGLQRERELGDER